MKIVRYEEDGQPEYGVVTENGVVNVRHAFSSGEFSPHDLLAPEIADKLAKLSEHPADCDLSALNFLPTFFGPQKIICVGVNYENRNEEYKDGTEPPKYPSLFMRSPDSFTGHKGALIRPKESDQLDYEGEITIVVGRGGRRISEADAVASIAGLTLMNEGTLRDWVRHAKFNVTQGKNFDRSGSVGPWMVTMDEIDSVENLSIKTTVNGEIRQDDNTANMRFPFAKLIAYISSFATLHPGDLIATGTPIGAGARFSPPRYLKPGDVVEVSSPSIGVLHNIVADEA